MNLRTYEILAKYIGQKHGIKVILEPNAQASANIKTKTIHMPSNISEDKVFTALTTILHEAAHIKYTTQIPEDLVKDTVAHMILNAIEDIRIDKKNFDLLPNIRDFYERCYKDTLKEADPQDIDKAPLHRVVLGNGILKCEDFGGLQYKRKDAQDFERKHGVAGIMDDTVDKIEYRDWKGVKENIERLIKIFDLQDQRKPLPKEAGKGEKGGKGEEGIGGGAGEEDVGLIGKNFGTGQGNHNTKGFCEIGKVALQEMTKNRFKELLNIKETRKVEDGVTIDTDNLTAFMTGDIDSLFMEDKTVHKKKSKIMILLDGSGSMRARLLDGSSKKSTVGACAREVIEILEEVRHIDGLNVDYEIGVFTASFTKCTKENWEETFSDMDGGTDLITAFKAGQEILLEDQELDGNKIIIVLTDGEVYENEIDDMKKEIIRHNEDVRCMIIGVGANVTGHFVKEVIGDSNIITKDCADIILMEAIMDALE